MMQTDSTHSQNQVKNGYDMVGWLLHARHLSQDFTTQMLWTLYKRYFRWYYKSKSHNIFVC